MGASESTIRQRTPLLPEPVPRSTSSAGKVARGRRNGPANGTLLAGMGTVGKDAAGRLAVSLPVKASQLNGNYAADSDCSTTAATSRSEDYESDGYPEAWSSPNGCCSIPMAIHSDEVRVIILDWDDTLLPTGFLRDAVKIYPMQRYNAASQGRRTSLRMSGSKPSRSSLSPLGSGFPCHAALEAHGELVKEVLHAARSIANVGIVTLAERPWVHESAEQYLPGLDLTKLLHDLDIPVYYASEYKKVARTPTMGDPAPALSKRLAMEDYISSLRTCSRSTRLSILSIGDSTAEREAARQACFALEKKAAVAGTPAPVCKTIKLQTDPSLKMLSFELRTLLLRLGRLAAMDKGLDLIFDQHDSIDDVEDKIIAAVGA